MAAVADCTATRPLKRSFVGLDYQSAALPASPATGIPKWISVPHQWIDQIKQCKTKIRPSHNYKNKQRNKTKQKSNTTNQVIVMRAHKHEFPLPPWYDWLDRPAGLNWQLSSSFNQGPQNLWYKSSFLADFQSEGYWRHVHQLRLPGVTAGKGTRASVFVTVHH